MLTFQQLINNLLGLAGFLPVHPDSFSRAFKLQEKLKTDKNNEEFDPDKYIEINGYELLLYK